MFGVRTLCVRHPVQTSTAWISTAWTSTAWTSTAWLLPWRRPIGDPRARARASSGRQTCSAPLPSPLPLPLLFPLARRQVCIEDPKLVTSPSPPPGRSDARKKPIPFGLRGHPARAATDALKAR
eukprot:scaffold803_cov310-Pinguiococcus_pyrenoidosus.AAC.27